MGDYSNFTLAPGDHVTFNGGTDFLLPERTNNSVPINPDLLVWGIPYTVRVLARRDSAPRSVAARVGDNAFQFFAENTGILDVHVEVVYPPGRRRPTRRLRPFTNFRCTADCRGSGRRRGSSRSAIRRWTDYHLTADPPERIAVERQRADQFRRRQHSYANWAPELMVFPVQSTEIWSAGGTGGIAASSVSSGRPAATNRPARACSRSHSARRAGATRPIHPQLRQHVVRERRLRTFVQATEPSGLKSHPSYGDETYVWDASQLSGAYYPIQIHNQN